MVSLAAPGGRGQREPTDSRRALSLPRSPDQVLGELPLTPARCKQPDLKNIPLAIGANYNNVFLRFDQPEGGHDPTVGVEQTSGDSVWSKAGDGRA